MISFAKGKVLHVGISDAPGLVGRQANTLAELRGWTQFIGLQIEYSLMERTVERELIPMAKALNLGVLACLPWRKAFCPASIMVRVRQTAVG